MIRIEDYEVWGIRKAVDGIRNSYSNRDKGDSSYSLLEDGSREFALGEKDLELMIRLVKEGQPCRKFLRMIHVQCDVTAPMYWWKQMDTYTIGKVQNSESTMHTLSKKPITVDDFSLDEGRVEDEDDLFFYTKFQDVVNRLEALRKLYIETKNKVYWRTLIQELPMSFNQMRTLDMNYEVLIQIYTWRRHHKLTEWHKMCEWIKDLPYMLYFIDALGIL